MNTCEGGRLLDKLNCEHAVIRTYLRIKKYVRIQKEEDEVRYVLYESIRTVPVDEEPQLPIFEL